ncbi:sensor histidine kinase [Steroidobacter sp.]|uniref:HAMP domain-containing sensor histidine kinase n=1 Tax=Steroidobacter sp. TaxID=1978227 RepID=UPI001A48001D|nr:HAMP domain-containing sensor histidine kinase [Steroidobacter sp.]MBL8265442.1 HAMP domain-containing histidine kinase [Steroidobacter sp.]
MKSLLFWKIMFGFWLTFIAVNQFGWLVVRVFSEPRPSYYRTMAEKMGPVQLGAVKAALESGGLRAVEKLQAAWAEDIRDDIEIHAIDPDARDVAPERGYLWVTAVARNGTHYLVTYELPAWSGDWSVIEALNPRDELLAMGMVGALFFSAGLAFYLTRPVQRIRKGFARLAGGDLSTRLLPSVGRRRDEIADLAKDFDTMAERLQQLVLMRDQLLHDVSHELRSPLARLNQAIALVRQDPANTDLSLQRIETEIRRLDELVGELLSLARAESGESSGDQYFDLHELIQTVVANVNYEARAQGVVVNFSSASPQEGLVRGNVELMRRTLENVLRNALRVSAAGQAIDVDLSTPDGTQFLVRVTDSGPGVPGNKLDKMFEPFVRIGNNNTNKGYGLGLAIARRGIVALGGNIEARNRQPRGLEVRITLPVHSLGTAAG